MGKWTKDRLEDVLAGQEAAASTIMDAREEKCWPSETTTWTVDLSDEDEKAIIDEALSECASVCLHDVVIPIKLPMVKANPTSEQYVLDALKDGSYVVVGEIAQMPGHVILMDLRTSKIVEGVFHDWDLVLVHPYEA